MEPVSDILKVRKRPGMYVGPIQDGTGLHNLVLGLVTEAIEDALANSASHIEVVLNGIAAEVRCLGSYPSNDAELRRLALARLEAAVSLFGARSHAPRWPIVDGILSVDLCVVNALSDWVCSRAWTREAAHTLTFRDGHLETDDFEESDAEFLKHGEVGMGTVFIPNRKIFETLGFDGARLRSALTDLGARNGNISIVLKDGP